VFLRFFTILFFAWGCGHAGAESTPGSREQARNYVSQASPIVRALTQLYSEEIFGSTPEEVKERTAKVEENLLAYFENYWANGGQEVRDTTHYDPLTDFRNQLRQYILKHSVAEMEKMKFLEAEAAARNQSVRPPQIFARVPRMGADENEPPRLVETQGSMNLQADYEKKILEEALKLEGQPNPLKVHAVPVPFNKDFRAWTEATLKSIMVRKMETTLRARALEQKLQPSLTFYLLDEKEFFSEKAKRIPIAGTELDALIPSVENVGRAWGDFARFTRKGEVPPKRYVLQTHDADRPKHAQLSFEQIAFGSERGTRSLGTQVFSQPENALSLLQLHAEIQASNKSLRTLKEVMENESLKHFPLRTLDEASKKSQVLATDELGLSRELKAYLGAASHDPEKWAARYERLRKLGPLLPVLTTAVATVHTVADISLSLKNAATALGNKVAGIVELGRLVAYNMLRPSQGNPDTGGSDGGDGGNGAGRSRGQGRSSLKTTTLLVGIALAAWGGYHFATHPESRQWIADYTPNPWSYFEGDPHEREREFAREMERLRESARNIPPAPLPDTWKEPEPPSELWKNVKEKWPYLAGGALAAGTLYGVYKKLKTLYQPKGGPPEFEYESADAYRPRYLEFSPGTDLIEHDFILKDVPSARVGEEPEGAKLKSNYFQEKNAGEVIPLALPRGQKLLALQVFSHDGELLTPGVQYDILYVPDRNGYFLRFKTRNLALRYTAIVEPRPTAGQFHVEDPGKVELGHGEVLTTLEKEYFKLGFDKLARPLAERAKKSDPVTTGELSRILNEINTYPYDSEASLSNMPLHELEPYTVFRRRGCLAGICNVGAGFGAASLNKILKERGSDLVAEVRPMAVMNSDGKSKGVGHAQVYLYRGDQLVDVVDFTPFNNEGQGMPEAWGRFWDWLFPRKFATPEKKLPTQFLTREELYRNWAYQHRDKLKILKTDLEHIKKVTSRGAVVNAQDPMVQLYQLVNLAIELMEAKPDVESLRKRLIDKKIPVTQEMEVHELLTLILAKIEEKAGLVEKFAVTNRGKKLTPGNAHYQAIKIGNETIEPMRAIAAGFGETASTLTKSLDACRATFSKAE